METSRHCKSFHAPLGEWTSYSRLCCSGGVLNRNISKYLSNTWGVPGARGSPRRSPSSMGSPQHHPVGKKLPVPHKLFLLTREYVWGFKNVLGEKSFRRMPYWAPTRYPVLDTRSRLTSHWPSCRVEGTSAFWQRWGVICPRTKIYSF